jgi:hypothetical protein
MRQTVAYHPGRLTRLPNSGNNAQSYQLSLKTKKGAAVKSDVFFLLRLFRFTSVSTGIGYHTKTSRKNTYTQITFSPHFLLAFYRAIDLSLKKQFLNYASSVSMTLLK